MTGRPLLAAAAALAILLLGGLRLGAPALTPAEVVAVESTPWRAIPISAPLEVRRRLPSLLAVALSAAVIVVAAGRAGDAAGLLAVALSPALVAAARSDGSAAWSCLAGATGAALLLRGRAPTVVLGVALVGFGLALPLHAEADASPPWLHLIVAGLGVLGGPALAPWRLDLVAPVSLTAVVLVWYGAGDGARRRTAVTLALVVIAGLAGARVSALGDASAAASALTPTVLLLAIRGVSRLPPRLPRWPIIAVTVGFGAVAIGGLHLARDSTDPARRVPWDEVARMSAVLAADGAALVASPAIAATLRLYAPELPVARAPHELDPTRCEGRVLVVSAGVGGALASPSAELEQRLGEAGFNLLGELVLEELEPGLAALLEQAGAAPRASYLRVRRFERR